MKEAILYYRVSTPRQGESGLGLEAQKQTVNNYVQTNGFKILAEFTEVQSGCNSKRPELRQALELCRKLKATLLIAKLDRLTRSVAFIAGLMESRMDFIAIDIPYGDNKIILYLMAAFAEHERDLISKRTKDALQAAKARGVQLGSYGKNVLSRRNRKLADEFALSMKSITDDLRHEGFTSIREMCAELNRRSVPTFHGQHWHPSTLCTLLKREKRLSDLKHDF